MEVRERGPVLGPCSVSVMFMVAAVTRVAFAQAPQQDPQQEPLVVTPSLRSQQPFNEPYWVDVIDAEQLRERSYRTLPQALRDLPGVMIQETSPGQGSPYIRGFTGFQNLLLIDGVRLNNSVFRSGPNQYWNTIDMLSVRRIEVLQGPAAAQYGSDAVGGVVQVFTSDPYAFAKDRGLAVAGSTYTRYASGEDSIWGRGELSIGHTWEDGSSTGMLLGGDAKSFGDIEGGRATGTQPGTSYDETAIDLKVEHWFSADERLVFLHQQTAQDDVPRVHSTIHGVSFHGTTPGSDLQRNYDQRRRLTYLQYHRTNMPGAVDGMHLNLSWQQQEEMQDRIRGSGTQIQDGFDVDTLGAFARLDSDAGSLGQLSYGFDYYRDSVDSYRRNLTSPSPADDIQGPVGDDSTYDLLGLYVQDMLELTDDLTVWLGARYTYAAADADSVRDPVTNEPIAVSDQWQGLTGNVRLRYDLDENWNLFAGVSDGFRAPNLRDLTSFDVARSGDLEVPATGLSPEKYRSYEVGTKARSESATGKVAWFYTDIEDQILRYPTGDTDPSGDRIVTKANVGKGYIQGIEFQGSVRMDEAFTLFGWMSYQYGRLTNFNDGGTVLAEEYPSRIMPLTGSLGLRWAPNDSDFYAETLVLHAQDADKLSSGDQRDTQRIPPGGTPHYTVWNLYAGWRLNDRVSLDLGLDNITNVDYRVHGSGSNAVGRNFVVGMRVTF